MKFEKLYADLRGGCCAVYPENRKDDTNGCNSDNKRNIIYSDKDAGYNGNYWDMDEKTQAYFKLFAAAPELLEALQNLENDNNPIPKPIWDMVQKAIKKATV